MNKLKKDDNRLLKSVLGNQICSALLNRSRAKKLIIIFYLEHINGTSKKAVPASKITKYSKSSPTKQTKSSNPDLENPEHEFDIYELVLYVRYRKYINNPDTKTSYEV